MLNRAHREILSHASDRQLACVRQFGSGQPARERRGQEIIDATQGLRIHRNGCFVGDWTLDAMALSERGGKVALFARSVDTLKRLAQQLPDSLPVTADMTQFDHVRRAVRAVREHYGRIDGLINNAGRSYAASLEEIDPALFDEIFHLNVLGPIVAMQAVIPTMRWKRIASS